MQIPGYQIERELGRGGMAVVYLATQENLNRKVALKVMAAPPADGVEFTQRFLREGRTTANLIHPNIIKIFDSGIHQDKYYLAMEYLPGGTLKDRIEAGLSVHQGLDFIKLIADALGYAHQQGIIHRDIKPQNILLYRNDTPVLSDFGIAKALSNSTTMTATGAIIGSPRYMSPEQIKSEPVDARSDLYALGVLFYELLTGQVPYIASDSIALAYKHVHDDIPKLAANLSCFQELIDRMLAKQAKNRFADVDQFLAALEQAEQRYILGETGDTVK